MAEQQLLDYIRTSQQSGMSLDTIKQDLLSAGWTQNQVDEAFRVVNIPRPSVPVPPTIATAKNFTPRKQYTSPYSGLLAVVLVVSLLILAQNAVTDILDKFAPSANNYGRSQEYADYQKAIMAYERTAPKTSEYSDTFAYSQAYRDWSGQRNVKERFFYEQYQAQYKARAASPSFRMILNAIIVLPFWILTFLLYLSLKDERKKFEALIGSYLVTSGWLLVFLLFNVASYIYNADTTVGVYIVLGMVIIVLTTAGWGIQKYRHSFNQEN